MDRCPSQTRNTHPSYTIKLSGTPIFYHWSRKFHPTFRILGLWPEDDLSEIQVFRSMTGNIPLYEGPQNPTNKPKSFL